MKVVFERPLHPPRRELVEVRMTVASRMQQLFRDLPRDKAGWIEQQALLRWYRKALRDWSSTTRYDTPEERIVYPDGSGLHICNPTQTHGRASVRVV